MRSIGTMRGNIHAPRANSAAGAPQAAGSNRQKKRKRKKDRCGSVLLPFSLRGILRRVEHVSSSGAAPLLDYGSYYTHFTDLSCYDAMNIL